MTVHLALQKMALGDALTGIQNRHALKLFFESIKDNQENLHTLVIDIDHFKSINDQFGHETGDKILIEMTELLKSRVDSKDIYRLGGEEFLVILEEAPDNEALSLAESLRRTVEQSTFAHEETDINITVSIGVSKFQYGQAFNEFLRLADKNLYRAKNAGRNQVCSG
ncbi:GGDEF domain-containing protein [Marinomonas transparens]|uniref:diguanylate cyclase n=1 Tax=Marinomonas transparens TaxID=2795388 RepID=A0A934JNL7_9GAMM|nr:GGDEF domain-containing protein [Marinomonas transparens]MBJ7537284.1 GGDEF domain-containing protein [Marinomonas transparens]